MDISSLLQEWVSIDTPTARKIEIVQNAKDTPGLLVALCEQMEADFLRTPPAHSTLGASLADSQWGRMRMSTRQGENDE